MVLDFHVNLKYNERIFIRADLASEWVIYHPGHLFIYCQSSTTTAILCKVFITSHLTLFYLRYLKVSQVCLTDFLTLPWQGSYDTSYTSG